MNYFIYLFFRSRVRQRKTTGLYLLYSHSEGRDTGYCPVQYHIHDRHTGAPPLAKEIPDWRDVPFFGILNIVLMETKLMSMSVRFF
jgi:hypothetical protein